MQPASSFIRRSIWCTERLSLDGIRNIQVSLADGFITGEGWYSPQK